MTQSDTRSYPIYCGIMDQGISNKISLNPFNRLFELFARHIFKYSSTKMLFKYNMSNISCEQSTLHLITLKFNFQT